MRSPRPRLSHGRRFRSIGTAPSRAGAYYGGALSGPGMLGVRFRGGRSREPPIAGAVGVTYRGFLGRGSPVLVQPPPPALVGRNSAVELEVGHGPRPQLGRVLRAPGED